MTNFNINRSSTLAHVIEINDSKEIGDVPIEQTYLLAHTTSLDNQIGKEPSVKPKTF